MLSEAEAELECLETFLSFHRASSVGTRYSAAWFVMGKRTPFEKQERFFGLPDRIKFLAQEVTATSGSSSGRPSEPIGTQRLPAGGLLWRLVAVSESKGVNKGFAATAPHFSPLSWRLNQFEGNLFCLEGSAPLP